MNKICSKFFPFKYFMSKVVKDQNNRIRYLHKNVYNDIPYSRTTYHATNSARDILLIQSDEEDEYDHSEIAVRVHDIFNFMDRMKNYPKIRKEYSIKFIKSLNEVTNQNISNEKYKNTMYFIYKYMGEDQRFFRTITLNQEYLNYQQFFYDNNNTLNREINIYLKLEIKISDLFEKKRLKYIHFNRMEYCKNCQETISNVKCKECKGKGKIGRLWILWSRVLCQACSGKGIVRNKQNCLKCENKRYKKIEKKIEVNLSNCSNNSYLSYPGYGHSLNKNKSGDLYIQIIYINDDSYEVKEDSNIEYKLKVDFFEAMLGFKRRIKTLNGTNDIVFPPGSRNKDTIRLDNMGLAKQSTKGNKILNGNMTVQLDVETPSSIKDLQIIKILEDISKFDKIENLNRLNKI